MKEEQSKVGPMTTYCYDTVGKVTHIIHSDGTVDTIANASFGSQQTPVDKHGKKTTYCYDSEGNQIEILNPEGEGLT